MVKQRGCLTLSPDKRESVNEGLGSTYAGLCRLNHASLGCDSQPSRGNTVGHETQFGIIRKAALYAGHGPATAKLFWDLWNKKQ